MIDNIKLFLGKIGISPIKYRLFLLLMLLPIIGLGVKMHSKMKELSAKQRIVEELNIKALKTAKNRNDRTAYLNKLIDSEPLFLSKNIEPLIFLSEEISMLESILNNDIFKENQMLINRCKTLKDGKNQLNLKETFIASNNEIAESEVIQTSPVEVSYNDLLKLLSLIENIPVNNFYPLDSAPLMFVKKIEIKKGKGNNLKLNNLTILKRDFIKR